MNGTPSSSSSSSSTAAVAAVLAVCVLLYRLTLAAVVEMTSRAEKLDMFEGDTVELVCEFVGDNFNLFHHPIVWHKMQRLHHHGDDDVYNESSQINMMATVRPPFATTKRFKPTFRSSPPNYRFGLLIRDVSAADVGNYTCRIGGPHNTLVASVTHELSVRADVDYLLISDDDNGEVDVGGRGGWPAVVRHKPRLQYVAGRAATLRCVVVGGRPAPTIRVRVSRTTQTAVETPAMTERRASRVEGVRGLRVERRATVLSSQKRFVTDVDDDEAVVSCEATVNGFASRLANATITVLYVKVLGCMNTTTSLGERNVFVSCELVSKPVDVRLYWVIDDNGTTVSEAQVIHEYWFLIMEQMDGVLEVQLYVKKVRPESFRLYTLVADNGFTSATASVAMTSTDRRSLTDGQRQSDYSHQRAVDASMSTRSVTDCAAAARQHCTVTFCFQHSVTLTLLLLMIYSVCPARR